MTTTDSTGTHLLAAILANPDDDTVRLVFADWLEESGEADRAEFIRVQVELDKGEQFEPHGCDVCGNTPDAEGLIEHGRGCYTQHEDGGGTSYADYTARYYALLERERTLFIEHRPGWFPVPPGRGLDWDIRLTSPFDDTRPDYVVRRGFVHSVTCSAEDWLAHADTILAQHPVQQVTLTTPLSPCSLIGFTTDPRELAENVRRLWKGITFSLPPEPEPPRIPLSRWHATLREELPQSVYGYRYKPGILWLDLETRVPGAGGAYRDLIGTRFGPLSARDDNGDGWVCEAILENAITDASRRELTTILTARSATNSIRAPRG